MGVKVAVVYPSISSFSGTAQLNIGPFNIPNVITLLRAEVRGKINFQGFTLGPTGVETNFQLWALQQVPAGAGASDCITTADGPQWLMRRQLGSQETRVDWTPTTNNVQYMATYPVEDNWAGQLPINASIDLWLSARAPTGVTIANMNLFASIRFWWT